MIMKAAAINKGPKSRTSPSQGAQGISCGQEPGQARKIRRKTHLSCGILQIPLSYHFYNSHQKSSIGNLAFQVFLLETISRKRFPFIDRDKVALYNNKREELFIHRLVIR
jgi:hypothetical protein